jgi:hypothetical protein
MQQSTAWPNDIPEYRQMGIPALMVRLGSQQWPALSFVLILRLTAKHVPLTKLARMRPD